MTVPLHYFFSGISWNGCKKIPALWSVTCLNEITCTHNAAEPEIYNYTIKLFHNMAVKNCPHKMGTMQKIISLIFRWLLTYLKVTLLNCNWLQFKTIKNQLHAGDTGAYIRGGGWQIKLSVKWQTHGAGVHQICLNWKHPRKRIILMNL